MIIGRDMEPIGCGELAELIEGTLRFAQMPPLGGAWEPIGRVTTCCESISEGDVYWAVETEHQGARRLREAFCRGARGAVCQSPEAPAFDGSFLVTVDDAIDTLCQFASWRRSHYEGKLAVVGPSLGAGDLSGVFQVLGCDNGAQDRPGATDQSLPQATLESVGGLNQQACQIHGICSAADSLTALSNRELSVFSLAPESLSEFDEISHLCCPHVICIYSLPLGNTSPTAPASDLEHVLANIEGFPDDLCLVHVDVDGQNVTLHREMPFESAVESVDWKSVLPSLPVCKRPAALTCWGVAKALGYSLPHDWLRRLARQDV